VEIIIGLDDSEDIKWKNRKNQYIVILAFLHDYEVRAISHDQFVTLL
jgi:hypothetical protein